MVQPQLISQAQLDQHKQRMNQTFSSCSRHRPTRPVQRSHRESAIRASRIRPGVTCHTRRHSNQPGKERTARIDRLHEPIGAP